MILSGIHFNFDKCFCLLREALLAEMGVAIREDGGTLGVFSPKKVPHRESSIGYCHASVETLFYTGICWTLFNFLTNFLPFIICFICHFNLVPFPVSAPSFVFLASPCGFLV